MMQTGSGKTYTMGTAFKDGTRNGLIPQVMSALFNKIDSVKDQMGFQLHVSFIEVSFIGCSYLSNFSLFTFQHM